MTSASASLLSNDHVTILGSLENLVNMLKSMSPRLPTISFPLQSPCPRCQAAISVSMTRLRVLLSHHPTATHHPPPKQCRRTAIPYKLAAQRLIIQYLTIGILPYPILLQCPPVSFCLVTRDTHPLIILTSLLPPPPAPHKIPKRCAPPKIQQTLRFQLDASD